MSLSSSKSVQETHVLVPTTPARTRRYDPTDRYVRRHQSLCPKVVRRDLTNGWVKYIHPEGKPYFYHRGDNIVTESNAESKHVRDALASWRDRIRSHAKGKGIRLTATTEMVLDLVITPTQQQCLYYLIDWAERREFWVDDLGTEALGMDAAFSPDHLELQISEHFWTHVEYFPMHHPMPKDADTDLVACLTHAATDQLTSELSTAPWTATECERFLQLLSYLKDESGVKTCIVARLLRTITHSQFINLYGHPGARLSRTQSILSEFTPSPSDRIAFLARLLLFNAPAPHLEALKELWVDRVVYAEHWSTFMKGLISDWSGIAVMAMLVVAVNVSRLDTSEPQNLSGVVNIASTFLGLSSIISSVLLLRRHRGAEIFNAVNAGAYLEDTHHAQLGHQPLAIIYALPYAFFLWSFATLSFSLVFSFYTILSPSLTKLSTAAIACLSGTVILFSVLYWSTVGFWGRESTSSGWVNRVQLWALRILAA